MDMHMGGSVSKVPGRVEWTDKIPYPAPKDLEVGEKLHVACSNLLLVDGCTCTIAATVTVAAAAASDDAAASTTSMLCNLAQLQCQIQTIESIRFKLLA